MRKCYVHSDRDHYATGFIEEIRRKWMTVRLFFSDDLAGEYTAEIKKSFVIKQQQAQLCSKLGRGRYFAFDRRKGRMHLCTCRWTARQLREAKKDAEELYEQIFER